MGSIEMQHNSGKILTYIGIISHQNRIIGQNWDFIEQKDGNNLALVQYDFRHLKNDMHRPHTNSIVMMLEPGMIGKTGMNSNGIGCVLMS